MEAHHSVWSLSQRGGVLRSSPIREISKLLAGRNDIISFAGGMPSPDAMPLEMFRRAADRVLTKHGTAALQYGPTAGYPPLRAAIAEQMKGRGCSISTEQVQILSGSQQAFDVLGKALCEPGNPLFVETPTYVGALQSFALMEPKIVGIDSDSGGLVVPALKEKFIKSGRGAGLLYIIPTFQNPTGRTLSTGRRVELAETAIQLGLPIIEDNPYDELSFDGKLHTPLLSLAPDNVCYLGSFSKVLSPGLRVGYVISPKALNKTIEQIKQAADLHSSTFSQMIVYEVISDLGYGRHLESTQALYARHAAAMLDALESHLSSVSEWSRPTGGMFLWLTLPEKMDADQLLRDAIQAKVAFVPGMAFYADRPQLNCLRLNFSNSCPSDIRKGIAALAHVVSANLAS